MPNTYLTKTFGGSPTSRTTMTISAWVKRSNLNTGYSQCAVGTDGNYEAPIGFESDGSIRITGPYMSTQQGIYITNAKFRDVSAWYHIVTQYDTTNATASDRMKLYVNGERITSFSSQTNSNQNNTTTKLLVSGQTSFIGLSGGSAYFDGCIANLYIIDGQALTPSSFGETDATTGIWKPKAYTGSYGTNGFFLKFENSGSLGTDSSGNGHNFTIGGGTPTQTVDTPSNVFATLNPLINTGTSLSNGNLTVTYSTNDANIRNTLGMSSGKWYWEAKAIGTASGMVYGICLDTARHVLNLADDTTAGIYGIQNGGAGFLYVDTNGVRTLSAGFPNHVANNILNFALDRDNNKFYIGINGTYYNPAGSTGNPATGTNPTFTLDNSYIGRTFMTIFETRSSSESANINFGNGVFGTTAISSPFSDGAGLGKFQYQPPTGYYSLCTKNINIYG